MVRSLLSIVTTPLQFHRNRATYYHSKKSFVPAFVRRFFLRYPQAPLYIVVAMLCSAMIGPSMHTVYLYLTMSPEEFKRYETERRLVVRERQKYGKSLWIPFFSSGTLEEQPTKTE
ncbi:hypothetical protein Q1695_014339 [Nippostrongylus brasiliensis]|nr:hypothetical protein Q1695_014339 [Nippostrongylus brasiliensis]